MTKGRTILKKKDKQKGKAASNYRPITCLLLVWKLLTGVIAEEIYGFLETNLLLPQERFPDFWQTYEIMASSIDKLRGKSGRG